MRHLESEIQKQIVRAVRYVYPKSLIFSVPNEGKRNVKTGVIMKAMGLMHGTSDLVFVHDRKVIFIEVKSKTGRQTEYQKDFQKIVESHGLRYWLVKSTEEVLTSIENLNLV